MAFVRVHENTVIYPYSTYLDHPNTSFPEEADYPSFDIYWVYPTEPDNPNPDTLMAVESTPTVNAEANRWEQAWQYESKPPEPNYEGLIAESRDGNTYTLIQDWYDNLNPRQRGPLEAAIAAQDEELIKNRLLPILPADQATLEQLVVLSNLESINALLIQQGLIQSDRLKQLNLVAISQLKTIIKSQSLKKLTTT